MIKFNRIGNKLGLAGVFGILLSGGMVANQMVSESAIKSANLRAEGQQIIADGSLEADNALRRMQVAVRDIRLSTTPAGVEKGAVDVSEAAALAAKALSAHLDHHNSSARS